jgi:hypothetical protein
MTDLTAGIRIWAGERNIARVLVEKSSPSISATAASMLVLH